MGIGEYVVSHYAGTGLAGLIDLLGWAVILIFAVCLPIARLIVWLGDRDWGRPFRRRD